MSEARRGAEWLYLAAAALALALTSVPTATAQQAGDACLACHGEKNFSTERRGKTVSLFVDGKRFSSSVHGNLSCTSCHADLEGKELPHSAPLARVDCGACH